MHAEAWKYIGPFIAMLLVVWLVYRMKKRVRSLVQNEIYNDFPAIRDTIDNFTHRLETLRAEIESLERRIVLLEEKVHHKT